MRKRLGVLMPLLAAVAFFAFAMSTNAQEENTGGITFPIPELGNCGSKDECKAFCNEPANGEACFAFAVAHGLISEDDRKEQEERRQHHERRGKVIEEQGGGPGGCNSEESCRAFCEDPVNAETCLAFVKEHELATEKDIQRIEKQVEHVKKQQEVIQTQAGPGGCTSKQECDAFCREPANRKACFEFAKEHNLLPKEELARVEKFVDGPQAGPGGCASKEECDAFCRNPQNTETCLGFAVANGHISETQANEFRRFKEEGGPGKRVGPQVRGPRIRGVEEPKIDEAKAQALLETQGGPGGCDSFEACEAFCNDPANEETCFAFAREHELLPPEELKRVEKLRTTEGPGGCRGRQCEQFCEQEGHEEECLGFAINNGLVAPEDVEHAQKFLKIAKEGGPGGCKGRACERFCELPENQQQCFEFAKQNQLIPPEEIERAEKVMGKLQQGGGPGGCKSESECRSFCSDPARFDECTAFAVDAGIMSPDDAIMKLQEFVGAGVSEEGQFGPPRGFGGFGEGGPQGFGPPGDFRGFGGEGEHGFGPGEGFSPQGFGPPEGAGPRGSFPGQGQGVPPELQGRFDSEFQKRFEKFQQFRSQFEQGGTGGFPGPGGFGQPGGEGGFPPGGQFGFPGEGEEGSGEGFQHGGEQGLTPGGQGGSGTPGGLPSRTGRRGPTGTERLPLPSRGNQGQGQFDHPQGGPGGPESVPGFEQEFQRQFEGETNRQFNQEFQNQFNDEFRRQFEQQSGGQVPPGGFGQPEGTSGQPPTGSFTPPTGTTGEFHPPTGTFPPPTGTFTPPPTGSFTPPTGTTGEFHPPTGTFPPPTGTFTSPPPTGTFPPPTGTFTSPPPTGTFPPPTGTTGEFHPPTETFTSPPPTFTPPPPPPETFTSPPPTFTPPPPPPDSGSFHPPSALQRISNAIASILLSLFGFGK